MYIVALDNIVTCKRWLGLLCIRLLKAICSSLVWAMNSSESAVLEVAVLSIQRDRSECPYYYGGGR